MDDLPAAWQATNYVFRQAGLPEMSLDRFRAEFCLPFRKFYDRFTPQLSLEKLEEWFHGHFQEVQHSVVELPHAREFLEFCRRRGLRTFVLSSVHSRYYSLQAATIGFDRFIDRPYVQIYDKRHKIQEMLAENGLAKEETLFIGDMQHDIESARHGGIHSCAVLTGYNTADQLREAAPDLIVEHLGELRDLLERGGLEMPPPPPDGRRGEEKPVATVGALIFDAAGEKALLVRTRKWSNLWGIPGGKIKWGETAEEALRREIREETGLEITGIEFVLAQDCIRSREFYRDAHFVLLNYRGRVREAGAVRLNDEAQEFAWLTLAEARKLALNRPTAVLIEAIERADGAGSANAR